MLSLKSISKAESQAKTQVMNVLGLVNGDDMMLFVWYFLVSSFQNAVNDVLVFKTPFIKSHPISSPAHVYLLRKNMCSSSAAVE